LHAALVAAGLALQGCASPGRPAMQTVRVETPGCALVSCELSNDQGTWQLPRTPGMVTLTTSHAPLKVSCRAEGGAQGSTGATSSVPSPSGAGAVTGGVVGGAAVGVAVGAAALSFIPVLGVITVLSGVAAGAATGQAVESRQQSIRYPELISVPMYCSDTAAATPPAGAALGLGIRGLPLIEARAAGLGERSAVLVTSAASASSWPSAAAPTPRGCAAATSSWPPMAMSWPMRPTWSKECFRSRPAHRCPCMSGATDRCWKWC
jgi:hypothetical protein